MSPQICCLKGRTASAKQHTFDGIHIINHYGRDAEAYQSSDEDQVKDPDLQDAQRPSSRIRLRPNLRDTDSEEDEDEEGADALRLSVPSGQKSTTV